MITITIPQMIMALLLLAFSALLYDQLSEPRPPQNKPALSRPIRAPVDKAVQRPSNAQPVPLAAQFDEYGDPEMKAAYFCELALSLRERCERVPRDTEGLEFCLKATGYYTNSRYCGYRP